MKKFFAAALLLITLMLTLDSQAQVQKGEPAQGRFYCTGVFDFNLRMDIDFFGHNANLQIFDTKTNRWVYKRGYFDSFYSNLHYTNYRVSPMDSIEFPADYKERHWFSLDYRQSGTGWIRFDCNHF